MQSLKMSVGSVTWDLPLFYFVCDVKKEEFALRISLGAKSADTRAASQGASAVRLRRSRLRNGQAQARGFEDRRASLRSGQGE
jgi:hypothetical protein